jgi:hypothetical protein
VLPTARTAPELSSDLADAVEAPAESPSAPTVASLLTRARSHEASRRDVSNRRTGGRHTPDYIAAQTHAIAALDLRLQAHDVDPQHTDPQWASDPLSHEQQVQWLRAYIARP